LATGLLTFLFQFGIEKNHNLRKILAQSSYKITTKIAVL